MVCRRTRGDNSRDNTYADESVIDAPNPDHRLIPAGGINDDRGTWCAGPAAPPDPRSRVEPLAGGQIGDPAVHPPAPPPHCVGRGSHHGEAKSQGQADTETQHTAGRTSTGHECLAVIANKPATQGRSRRSCHRAPRGVYGAPSPMCGAVDSKTHPTTAPRRRPRAGHTPLHTHTDRLAAQLTACPAVGWRYAAPTPASGVEAFPRWTPRGSPIQTTT